MQKLPVNAIADIIDTLGLSPAERLLFDLLLSQRGFYVSSRHIHQVITGLFDDENGKTVPEIVSALRAKLDKVSDIDICQLDEAGNQTSFMLR